MTKEDLKPKCCEECRYIGDYTSGLYYRNPHYCCELVWALFELDYRVKDCHENIDSRCPLKNEKLVEAIIELNKTFDF